MHLQADQDVSERRVCRLIEIARGSKRRPSVRTQEAKLIRPVHDLSQRHPRFGYRKIFARLRAEGFALGRERIRLIQKREGLQVPQKRRKRRRKGKSTAVVDRALVVRALPEPRLELRLRFLTVIDEFTREGIWVECARYLNSHDVVRVNSSHKWEVADTP
jgi:hypothetical protein